MVKLSKDGEALIDRYEKRKKKVKMLTDVGLQTVPTTFTQKLAGNLPTCPSLGTMHPVL